VAVPDFQSAMLPLLRYAAGQKGDVSTSSAVDALAKELALTEQDLQHMLPSGTQPTFYNRVGWAATYLKKAGLLEASKRGFYRVTKAGNDVLASHPERIDLKFLSRFPEFVSFRSANSTREESAIVTGESSASTPLEALEQAHENLRSELAEELLSKLKHSSPSHFERIVVELLVKMGYGGSRSDAGKAIGRSGDGGIDGIIKEDRLGLELLYVQAKRWDSNPVGRPDVMQFAGALQAHHATKGIFITTSRFTTEAKDYVKQIGSKIVLIDGVTLAELMIDHAVGVSTLASYAVHKIDSDYFEEA
jgi:restriction system protein